MRGALFRVAVMAFAALTAGCAGTSRVGDELTATSLSQSRKAVALIKLGAADSTCTVLQAGIGVREGEHYRIIQTARIQRSANETAVAELELGTGEYHVVSFTCNRPRGGISQLAEFARRRRLQEELRLVLAGARRDHQRRLPATRAHGLHPGIL